MRIAIATVGTTGDVVPFTALAAALRGAGHEVVAVSWELHRRAFEAAGVTFVPAGPDTDWALIRATAERAAAARNPLDQVGVLRDFHLRDAVAHYRHLREVLPGHDLVLLHGIHSLGEAAARDAGVRWATAVFDPVLQPTAERPPPGMPSLGPVNRLAWWMLERVLGRAGAPLRAALRSAGSDSAGDVALFRGRSPLLHLVACSPVLAPPPRDWPSQVRTTGAWGLPDKPAPLPGIVSAFLDAGTPPAVVTFGSMASTDAARIAAAARDGVSRGGLRLVLQGLDAPGGSSAGELVIGDVDHRSLFPRAAVVVHHGGAGTTHAVAAAGVPSVVVPHIGDQAFWATRLQALGVAPAPVPARRLDGPLLADRLRQATADGPRARARQLAERLRGEAGIGQAVAAIESLGPAPPTA